MAIDPGVNQSDLGSDPIEFARRRLILARELWDRWQQRELKDGESYAVLRRTVGRGLTAVGMSASTIAKYVGGVSTLRDHAGSRVGPDMGGELDRRRPCDRQPGVEGGRRESVDRAQQGETVDGLGVREPEPAPHQRLPGLAPHGEGGVVGMQAQVDLAHERRREGAGRLHADTLLR